MCSICLEGVEGCLPMLCGHSMHIPCQSELLKRALFNDPAKCPLCRGPIEAMSEADRLCLFGYENDDESALRAALRLDPNHVYAMYSLGLYKLIQGDAVSAVDLFRRGTKAPILVTATRYYQHRIAANCCRVEIATLCYEHDMLDEAKAVLNEAAAEYAELSLAKSKYMVNVYVGYACIATAEMRFDDAVAAYEDMLTTTETTDLAMVEMYIKALRDAGQIVKMVETARQLLGAIPSARVHSVLGSCLTYLNEPEADREAVGLLQVACANSEADCFVHIASRFLLGELSERMGGDLEAIQHYLFVIKYREHPAADDANRKLSALLVKYEMCAQPKQ